MLPRHRGSASSAHNVPSSRSPTPPQQSTNWWLEELIEAGKPLPQEAPAPEARDWFL
jgi:hypothetical protein